MTSVVSFCLFSFLILFGVASRNKMTKRLFLAVAVLLHTSIALSQASPHRFLGKWAYQVEANIFGTFSGILEIWLDPHGELKGMLTNSHGEKFRVEVERTHAHRIVFSSNFENSDATFFCDFYQGDFKGVIEVRGDTYLYLINGKRMDP